MFVKLPMQELQKITDAVASMDQNLPINESHFFSQSAVGCNDVNFQQTLQREAF